MHHKRRQEMVYSSRSNFVAVKMVGSPFQGECVRWLHFLILDPNIMSPAGYADLHNPRHGMGYDGKGMENKMVQWFN